MRKASRTSLATFAITATAYSLAVLSSSPRAVAQSAPNNKSEYPARSQWKTSPFHGVIGGDLLLKHNAVIDYKKETLKLTSKKGKHRKKKSPQPEDDATKPASDAADNGETETSVQTFTEDSRSNA